MKTTLLVTAAFPEEELERVAEYAEIHRLSELGERELDAILPSIDSVLVHFWPERLDRARISRMTRLRFVQSVLAGVNHIPFADLGDDVVVCSNAGGYSDEVGEFAWALLLSAAKRIVKMNGEMRSKGFERSSVPELGRRIQVMKGRTLGVLGHGGIGRTVAKLGKAFGMEVVVFSRREADEPGIVSLKGRAGLETVLRQSDALVVALPHTKSTNNLIGAKELSMMKEDAVLVNVARAEIVDEEAVYRHLITKTGFVYATDVWWMEGGRESYSPRFPFLELDNFIGTPHASGPSAVAGRGPHRTAAANMLRYFKGEKPINVVDRSEYT